MLIFWEYFKTKMKKIGLLERMLHCVKIDKFKKMTLYIIIACAVTLVHVRKEKESGGERGVRKNWREKEQNVDYGGMVQP